MQLTDIIDNRRYRLVLAISLVSRYRVPIYRLYLNIGPFRWPPTSRCPTAPSTLRFTLALSQCILKKVLPRNARHSLFEWSTVEWLKYCRLQPEIAPATTRLIRCGMCKGNLCSIERRSLSVICEQVWEERLERERNSAWPRWPHSARSPLTAQTFLLDCDILIVHHGQDIKEDTKYIKWKYKSE